MNLKAQNSLLTIVPNSIKKMIIIVTGTPGTGKTALARELSLLLHIPYLDVNQLIREKGLSEGYDEKRGCHIVNPKKLAKELLKVRKTAKNLIIDSHMSHLLPSKAVGLCIVTKCGLKTLDKRLKAKGYSREKVRENLDAEIFDICLNEAVERKHSIMIVDTTKNSAKTIAKRIVKRIKTIKNNQKSSIN